MDIGCIFSYNQYNKENNRGREQRMSAGVILDKVAT